MIRFFIDIKFLRILVMKLSQSFSKIFDKRYKFSNRVFIVFLFYQIVKIEFVEKFVWNFINFIDFVVFNDFDFVEFLCDFHFHVFVSFNIFNSIKRFRKLWRLRAFFFFKIEFFQKEKRERRCECLSVWTNLNDKFDFQCIQKSWMIRKIFISISCFVSFWCFYRSNSRNFRFCMT